MGIASPYIYIKNSTAMETYNQSNTPSVKPGPNQPGASGTKRNGRLMGGLFIVLIGVAIFAHKAGADIPRWLFSFETLLMAIGLYIGFRHSFKGFVWVIPILIGGLLLVDDFYPYYDLDRYWFPLMIILIGLFIAFKPKRSRTDSSTWKTGDNTVNASEDLLDSTVVFGSVKKNVISKNFRGGDVVNVFGGTEINLMQADLDGQVVLDLTMIFAGTKLLIPAHWKVQNEELVTIFGGIEDKRPMLADVSMHDQNKVIVLKGTCIFGGIDIKSY
jgi:hypothetical protein